MTPQAFSYPEVGNNGMIYVAPYGLTESLDYMIKLNPTTLRIEKIKIKCDDSKEKWIFGIRFQSYIIFLPYNESSIMILDTTDDSIKYIPTGCKRQGKYVSGHIFNNHLYALPYGEENGFNSVLKLNLKTFTVEYIELDLPADDCKKWHTTQIMNGIIYGVPRGGNPMQNNFNFVIEYNCNNDTYKLIDMGKHWIEHSDKIFFNKKFTTLAKSKNKLYAPPYSELPEFDIMLKYDNEWKVEKTNLKFTSRKYYTHTTAKNGKIFFPPAGHDEAWSEMLIIDPTNDSWKTIDLGIGKESKKYFSGVENSQGKIYYIPRGGCVCEPKETWKSQGDLAEVLVIDSDTEKFHTVDVREYFKDNTTIEKYNKCVIINDIIYAFPYGESDSFQTILIFDTINEKVKTTVDLNGI